ncbi:PIP5K1C, partial [Symbiodinium sp. KB8]
AHVNPPEVGRHRTVSFVAYYPEVFRDLRAHGWGVTDEDFLHSICNAPLTSNQDDGLEAKRLVFSSWDKKYLAKTVLPDEVHFFADHLPAYHRYMRGSPSSLLPRFCGLYSLQFPREPKPAYLVVIQNPFAAGVKMKEKYEVKGVLTSDRYVSREDREKGARLLKDRNLIQRSRLRLGPVSPLLHRQLQEDVSFLEARGRVEYSLLLGVASSSEAEQAAALTGGLRTVDADDAEGDEVVFMGLAEIFQEYAIGRPATRVHQHRVRDVNGWRNGLGIAQACPLRQALPALSGAADSLKQDLKQAYVAVLQDPFATRIYGVTIQSSTWWRPHNSLHGRRCQADAPFLASNQANRTVGRVWGCARPSGQQACMPNAACLTALALLTRTCRGPIIFAARGRQRLAAGSAVDVAQVFFLQCRDVVVLVAVADRRWRDDTTANGLKRVVGQWEVLAGRVPLTTPVLSTRTGRGPMNGATRERQRLAAGSAVDAALSFPAVEMSSRWFLSPTDDTTANGLKRVVGQWEVLAGCVPLTMPVLSTVTGRGDLLCYMNLAARGRQRLAAGSTVDVAQPASAKSSYDSRRSRTTEAACLTALALLTRTCRGPIILAARGRQRLAAGSAVDVAQVFFLQLHGIGRRGVDPDVRRARVGKTRASGSRAVDAVEMSSCWLLSPTGRPYERRNSRAAEAGCEQRSRDVVVLVSVADRRWRDDTTANGLKRVVGQWEVLAGCYMNLAGGRGWLRAAQWMWHSRQAPRLPSSFDRPEMERTSACFFRSECGLPAAESRVSAVDAPCEAADFACAPNSPVSAWPRSVTPLVGCTGRGDLLRVHSTMMLVLSIRSSNSRAAEVECCCEPGRPAYNYAGAAQPHTVTPEEDLLSGVSLADLCPDGHCVVPAGHTWILDHSIDVETLTIYGTVKWDTSKADLELRSNYILVGEGGYFQVGSRMNPMLLNATIYIKKSLESHQWFGDRFLASEGEARVEIHGRERLGSRKLKRWISSLPSPCCTGRFLSVTQVLE